ncbi:MAG: hypothetical protein VR73_09490 [Gammaproteobacteria bacterium BRH_c0]|nr:MAG: hypothetical protein VR73_09490 [Gammaproteobacteria bacterium BRH_c0]
MNTEMTKGNNALKPIALAVSIALLSPVSMAADSIKSALEGGKVSANVRLRYEAVEDDAVANDADALTVRTRLGYETAPFKGFSAVVEMEDIHSVFGVDDYAPERAGYAVIADPSETELNRAYLRYRGISKLDLGFGRQRINYDNQRFVGSVGWRQDDQTFDGFTAAYSGVADLLLNYAYLTKVNGITEQFDSSEISDNLFNASYSGFTWGKFTAYAYLLDHEDETDPNVNAGLRFKTSDTLGLRFEGAYPLPISRPVKLLYAAEYASQDFENTAGTIERDADYHFVEGGVNVGLSKAALVAKLSYEVLGSDDGAYGFQTPYGTKHAFNGWTDKFLVTPAGGLKDKYVTVGLNLLPYAINLLAVYHDYEADEGSADYGSEWNLQAVKVFSPTYTVGIKYSAYDGEDLPYRDTNKLWLWGEVNF